MLVYSNSLTLFLTKFEINACFFNITHTTTDAKHGHPHCHSNTLNERHIPQHILQSEIRASPRANIQTIAIIVNHNLEHLVQTHLPKLLQDPNALTCAFPPSHLLPTQHFHRQQQQPRTRRSHAPQNEPPRRQSQSAAGKSPLGAN